MQPVIKLWIKRDCPVCDCIKNYLTFQLQWQYQELDIRYSPENLQSLIQETGQNLTPTARIDNEHCIDCDLSGLIFFLRSKGHQVPNPE